MAYFNANPTSTTGVEIAAAATGQRARFLFMGFANMTSTARTVTVFDGTAVGGTARMYISLPGMATVILDGKSMGINSVVPKTWWTAGSVIECNCDGSSSVRVFGEIVREP